MKEAWMIKNNGQDDIVTSLLKNRGIVGETEITSFLNPDWDRDTYDPAEFKQMKRAVERILLALQNKDKIVIHGDYDADGVCGTTLLFSCLAEIAQKIGVKVNLEVFLPDREQDGYGVALHNVEKFRETGVDLLITVDCGIANAVELDRAHELGIDVIICDHHQLAPTLPQHAIIIHPLAPGETYQNKNLCGTGVAYKVASALIETVRNQGFDFPIGHEKWYLDLVAIATVTDIVPLIGENRTLEKYGLVVLNKTRREGLKQLAHISRTALGTIDTTAIGFRLGPRINAAGRLKSAKIAFEALSSVLPEQAIKYSEELEILNRDRRQISEAAYKEAKVKIIESEFRAPISVVWSETWNPGIIGLIAGKIVSEFGVPAFVLTKVGENYVGSGRSFGGLHLVEAMRSCGDIFIKSGGHPQACGLTLASEDLVYEFKSKVEDFANGYFDSTSPKLIIEIDRELKLSEINWELFTVLSKLAPFGQGNPEPVFSTSAARIISANAVGATGSHLSLKLGDGDRTVMKCIGFGLGRLAEKLSLGSLIDVVYTVQINEWQGNRELQCQLIDLDVL